MNNAYKYQITDQDGNVIHKGTYITDATTSRQARKELRSTFPGNNLIYSATKKGSPVARTANCNTPRNVTGNVAAAG